MTGTQLELKTNSMLLERTVEDLKRDNERLQAQAETLTKKLE
jgi:hypothetical protein